MKKATLQGVLAGFLLALGILLGGAYGFFLVLIFCAIGGVIGAHFDGYIDLRSLLSTNGRGRG